MMDRQNRRSYYIGVHCEQFGCAVKSAGVCARVFLGFVLSFVDLIQFLLVMHFIFCTLA